MSYLLLHQLFTSILVRVPDTKNMSVEFKPTLLMSLN